MSLLNVVVVLPKYSHRICLSNDHHHHHQQNLNNNHVINSRKQHALIASAAFSHIIRRSKLQHGSRSSSLLIKCASSSSSTITTTSETSLSTFDDVVLRRSDFPSDFQFGATSSAIQTEGKERRAANTWDGLAPDKAVDSLHKFKQDVEMLKFMGADAYRLSISMSRLFPDGSIIYPKQEGIDFYNNLINLLIQNGIEPIVTLFHFDMPSALKSKYNGFLRPNIVYDYSYFADICFKNFGDRVKRWVTFNEPQLWASSGYMAGDTATVDPAKDPYTVAHNILISHARAVEKYRNNYQGSQGGEIGMSLGALSYLPWLANSREHIDACYRAWDFLFGWFAEPMITGDYPFIMKALVGKRLPSFTTEEKELLKGSCDFIGVNYYTSRYAQGLPINPMVVPASYADDRYVKTHETNSNGDLIGPKIGPSSNIYPAGIREVLRYIKNNYNNPKMYITENGISTARNDENPIWKELEDDVRIDFIKQHLINIRDAVRIDEANVAGYLVWALMDNVEWGAEYNLRFGLSFIDYNNDFTRYPKKSAKWFRNFNMNK